MRLLSSLGFVILEGLACGLEDDFSSHSGSSACRIRKRAGKLLPAALNPDTGVNPILDARSTGGSRAGGHCYFAAYNQVMDAK